MTTNKKGVTLVELLVYMVLAAFLLAPVIMLVQHSSISMARDAGNANLRMSGRELLNLMYDDLRNTGYKLSMTGSTLTVDTAVSYVNTTAFGNYVNSCQNQANGYSTEYGKCPANYDNYMYEASSFIPGNRVESVFYDMLTVCMGRLDNNGAWDGIDTITYKVENGDLTRIKGSDAPMTLARNVMALKFLYSDNLSTWYETFDASNMETKNRVEYIKVVLVLKDDKKLSPVNNQKITVIEGIDTTFTDKALYERHEMVIPIHNNGLFPVT